MKNNNKKIIIFLVLSMIFSLALSGCANEKDKIDQNEKPTKNEGTNQGDRSAGKYSAQGKIVKIDENGIHVQIGDRVQRYNVDKEATNKHYIGEYVGINELDNDKYDILPDETYDYKNRLTSTGEKIKRVTGTVGEVKDDIVTAVTEMGDIKLTNPGNFSLKSGDQFMFDYVEMGGGNQMLSYYEESSKINVKVKEISREASGAMKITANSNDNKEYNIMVNENTITNFAHSALKKDDSITVYPESITGNIPAEVKAKLIIKN